MKGLCCGTESSRLICNGSVDDGKGNRQLSAVARDIKDYNLFDKLE